jgi:hypothetical protein
MTYRLPLLIVLTTIAAPSALLAVGAKTHFTTLEAEAAMLHGSARVHGFPTGSPIPTAATLELEASGGALVRLDQTGAGLSWRNPVADANTIVIRNSIPDTTLGGGQAAPLNLYVDGKLRQALRLSSEQSWVYRTPQKGWLDDPASGGMPFHFYNEDRAFITGAPIPRGSMVSLRKDADNTASEYNIDCIDLEAVSPPNEQPRGSLSVLDFGAKPDAETDSQKAIQLCIKEARAKGMSVWIPAGRYVISSETPGGLEISGVSVQGAGMWHTTLFRKPPINPAASPHWRSYVKLHGKAALRDLSIDSNSIRRGLGQPGGGDYGVLASGDGWLIERVWVRHCDAQWLSGSNGTIRDSRVSDSWGDGINLNNGNSPHPDKVGANLTAENNFVRGSGDDGLATYSDLGEANDNSSMTDTRFLNNTSIAPYWANCLRIAGGRRVIVRDNLLTDSAAHSGMHVGVYGKSGDFLESAIIEGNIIRRGGGWSAASRHGMVVASHADKPTTAIIRNNVIEDSRRAGLMIDSALHQLTLINNRIIRPASTGILISPRVAGTVRHSGNAVQDLRSGEELLKNHSPSSVSVEMLR